jgi:hypothetical protein
MADRVRHDDSFVIPLRGMTAAVFLCMSKLLRSKTLHVIPRLTRNLLSIFYIFDKTSRRSKWKKS